MQRLIIFIYSTSFLQVDFQSKRFAIQTLPPICCFRENDCFSWPSIMLGTIEGVHSELLCWVVRKPRLGEQGQRPAWKRSRAAPCTRQAVPSTEQLCLCTESLQTYLHHPRNEKLQPGKTLCPGPEGVFSHVHNYIFSNIYTHVSLGNAESGWVTAGLFTCWFGLGASHYLEGNTLRQELEGYRVGGWGEVHRAPAWRERVQAEGGPCELQERHRERRRKQGPGLNPGPGQGAILCGQHI